ncbi:hypothetical protein C3K47_15175 [Solitalea longa]|uniref:ATP-binding protein n=1 Tax=Solitalea longa TaxID=2079460 RepID=A0A2S4ZZK7_9SPHI|nr:hypothetical protein [Solitalea longa]POY35402.1 hypothetical protein C3K47_15175 [Solitalea longa]
MQKKSLLIAAFVLTMLKVKAQSTSIQEIKGFNHPESVVQHGNFLYVSDIGEKMEPSQIDGDGFISKVNFKKGKVEELKFITGLNAPKGSAFIDDVLYIADINRVVGYNVTTRQNVFELPVSGSKFLNDVEATKGKLYVSDTDLGKVFELDVKSKTYKLLATEIIPGANGLSYSDKTTKLYCVGFSNDGQNPNGNVYAIDLSSLKTEKISKYEGYLDGAVLKNNKLYISDWKAFEKKGVLAEIDLSKNEAHTITLANLINGPADFTVSTDGRYFIIPAMLDGSILIEKIQ